MLGTIMAWNVFFVIIPAQRELVRAKQQGREPDPEPGLRAKQRSVHNNYLTLPVVFTMLAGHFPLAFGSEHAWLVLLAIFVLVSAIRHFFNLWHVGRRAWWILVAAAVGAVALAIVLAPEDVEPAATPSEARGGGDRGAALHGLPLRCLRAARDQARRARRSSKRYASEIERQVSAGAMPPGNATGMTEEERAKLVAWAAAAG